MFKHQGCVNRARFHRKDAEIAEAFYLIISVIANPEFIISSFNNY
jgi:hypothetical protein